MMLEDGHRARSRQVQLLEHASIHSCVELAPGVPVAFAVAPRGSQLAGLSCGGCI